MAPPVGRERRRTCRKSGLEHHRPAHFEPVELRARSPIARQVSATEFGAFALSFAIYGYLVTVSRMLVSQPLAIRFGGAEPAVFARAARQSTGAAIVVGLLPAAVLLLTGVSLGGAVGWMLAATGGPAGSAAPGRLADGLFRVGPPEVSGRERCGLGKPGGRPTARGVRDGQ